jgi:hypothetical protein
MTLLDLQSPGDFFPPLQDGDETPEFLRWAIGYECGIREQFCGDELEDLHRHLRPLAAASEAIRRTDGSHCERVYVRHQNEEYELNSQEVLSFYGASDLQDVACLNCPANSLASTLVNCIGIVARLQSCDAFTEAIEARVDAIPDALLLIPRTTPAWYGLWARSPIFGHRLRVTSQLVSSALLQVPEPTRPLRELARAMQSALTLNVPLHVRIQPPGIVAKRRWHIPAHCGFCGGARQPKLPTCRICGSTNQWQSGEKRHLIGIRPYRRVNKIGST